MSIKGYGTVGLKKNADKYQNILQNAVIPGIEAKNISGLKI